MGGWQVRAPLQRRYDGLAGAELGGVLYVCGADAITSLTHALAGPLLSLHGVTFHASHAAVMSLGELVRVGAPCGFRFPAARG